MMQPIENKPPPKSKLGLLQIEPAERSYHLKLT